MLTVFVVTKRGTLHRAQRNRRGVQGAHRRCNIDGAGRQEFISEMRAAGAAKRECHWCYGNLLTT